MNIIVSKNKLLSLSRQENWFLGSGPVTKIPFRKIVLFLTDKIIPLL